MSFVLTQVEVSAQHNNASSSSLHRILRRQLDRMCSNRLVTRVSNNQPSTNGAMMII